MGMDLKLSGLAHYWAFVVHPNLTWDVNLYSAIRRPSIADRVVPCGSEQEAEGLALVYSSATELEKREFYGTGQYTSRTMLLLEAE